MLFNESPDSSGYPRKAFFHVTTAADKQALLNIISGLRSMPTRATMHRRPKLFTRRTSGSPARPFIWGTRRRPSTIAAAFTDASKTRYVSPGVGCAKNHIIYLANGKPAGQRQQRLALLRRLNPSAVRKSIPVAEASATVTRPTGRTNSLPSSIVAPTWIRRSKARRTSTSTRWP